MTKGMVVATVADAATLVDVGTATEDEADVEAGEGLPFDEHAARKRATPMRGSRAETPSRLGPRSADPRQGIDRSYPNQVTSLVGDRIAGSVDRGVRHRPDPGLRPAG
jgi:hypothetical protein